jgi:hypothetical protein
VVEEEATQFFTLVDSDEAWEAPTGAGHWRVRDIVGHIVDTTEAYFPAFDAARNHAEVDPPYGLPGMAARVDPAFQLMDYGVHSWDVREGTGHAHGLSGEAADLLTPFMFVLWKYTTAGTKDEPFEIGVRITSGPNAGDTKVSIGAGMDYEPGPPSDGTTVLEFDPGSFVLTAFGRSNAGTIRGERSLANRYLNLFFRI